MSAILYRQAEPSDFKPMAQLRAQGRGREEFWLDRITGYFEGEHNPQMALPQRIGFVALDGDQVIGLITGHLSRRYSCDGEVQWIHVAPEHRRHGVASELLRLLAQWFAGQNALRICVNVDPSNTPGLRFYSRHGAQMLNPHWLVWNDIRVVLADTTSASPENPAALDLRGMTPLIQVYDMPASLAFYCDILGFEVHSSSQPPPQCHWAWLKRDGIDLMLNTAYEDEHRPASPDLRRVAAHDDTGLFFGCPDVDAAYEYLTARGVKANPPRVAPYGMKQLYFKDPDGYGLCFQRPARKDEP